MPLRICAKKSAHTAQKFVVSNTDDTDGKNTSVVFSIRVIRVIRGSILFIRIRLLPKGFAAEIHRGLRFDGAIAHHRTLAGQSHFLLVADRLEGVDRVQAELFDEAGLAEIFLPLLDENAASRTQTVSHAIQARILEDPPMKFDAGLARLIAQVGSGG